MGGRGWEITQRKYQGEGGTLGKLTQRIPAEGRRGDQMSPWGGGGG